MVDSSGRGQPLALIRRSTAHTQSSPHLRQRAQRLPTGHGNGHVAFGKVPMSHAVGKIPMNAPNSAQTLGQPREFLGGTSQLLSRCQGTVTHSSWPILHTAQLASAWQGCCLCQVLGAHGLHMRADSPAALSQPCLSPFTSTHIGQPGQLSAQTAAGSAPGRQPWLLLLE